MTGLQKPKPRPITLSIRLGGDLSKRVHAEARTARVHLCRAPIGSYR